MPPSPSAETAASIFSSSPSTHSTRTFEPSPPEYVASSPEFTFPRFPYDGSQGYMVAGDCYDGTRLGLLDDWKSDLPGGV